MGFPRELAHDLVVETLIGSAEYAAQSELHPAQLRNAVTSPGGTSAAAIYELEKGRHSHRPVGRRVGRLPPHAGARRAPRGGGGQLAHSRSTGAGGTVRPMFAIVMAGGVGTRLWPLSRRRSPKQLLALTGDTSLLQQTVARLGTLLKPHDIYVITSQAHVRATQEQLPQLPADNVFGEPLARSTAVAAGLGDGHGAPRVRRDRPGAAGRPLPRRRRGIHRGHAPGDHAPRSAATWSRLAWCRPTPPPATATSRSASPCTRR